MGNALEVKEMNRQQRRAYKKTTEWINSLSKDKKEIIENYATGRAKEMLYKSEHLGIDMILTNIDTSISATLIYLYNTGRKDIEKFLKTFSDILDEMLILLKMRGRIGK